MENPNNSSSSNVRIFPGCEEEYAGNPFVSGNLFTGDDLLFVTCAALGRQVSEALAKPSHIYAGSSDEGHGWLWGSSVVKRADHWTDTLALTHWTKSSPIHTTSQWLLKPQAPEKPLANGNLKPHSQ